MSTAEEPEVGLPLLPAPTSALFSGTAPWVTSDPFHEVRVGVSDELPRTHYTLSIHADGAWITAGSEAALADGRNMFAQIVYLARCRDLTDEAAIVGGPPSADEPRSIPAVTISDAPAHAWRALMIDVARHFVPLEELRLLIDVMAVYRLNVLHLHLTDDQGWRFEVRGYPALTEVGAWRERTVIGTPRFDGSDTFTNERHGGFYTQDELSELVAYAHARGVQIVPEVSMPGHVQAAIAAYPTLGATDAPVGVRETWGVSPHVLGTSDTAFQFVRDVLEQLTDVFDSPFIHVGGQDVPLEEWERSPEAAARLQEWGYTREAEILGRFTTFASQVLASRERRMVVWDTAPLVRVPDDAVVLHTGDGPSLATLTSRGFQTVAASRRVLGLDHPASQLPLERVFTGELVPPRLPDDERALVLGLDAQIFTEYLSSAGERQRALMPRLLAVAQRAWGASEMSWPEFEERVHAHAALIDLLGLEAGPTD